MLQRTRGRPRTKGDKVSPRPVAERRPLAAAPPPPPAPEPTPALRLALMTLYDEER